MTGPQDEHTEIGVHVHRAPGYYCPDCGAMPSTCDGSGVIPSGKGGAE